MLSDALNQAYNSYVRAELAYRRAEVALSRARENANVEMGNLTRATNALNKELAKESCDAE